MARLLEHIVGRLTPRAAAGWYIGMTLSLWALAGFFLIGVSPLAIAAAYFYEQRRKLASTVGSLNTELAAARASSAAMERAAHRREAEVRRLSTIAGKLAETNAQLQAVADESEASDPALESAAVTTDVPAWCEPGERLSAAHLAELEALATQHAIDYLVLAQAAVFIQQRLVLSRTEVLRLDTELRRRPARDEGDVPPAEWAAIKEAAAAQVSRTAVARAVFGNTGKASYAKVKFVCDAEGLLMPEPRSSAKLGSLAGVAPYSADSNVSRDAAEVNEPADALEEVVS